MRDFIERMEDAAETGFYEMTKDCPAGHFRCGCGRLDKFDNTGPYSNDPYALPICGQCWDEWAKGKK